MSTAAGDMQQGRRPRDSSSSNSTRTLTTVGGRLTAADTTAGMPVIKLATTETPTATEMPEIVRMPTSHEFSPNFAKKSLEG